MKELEVDINASKRKRGYDVALRGVYKLVIKRKKFLTTLLLHRPHLCPFVDLVCTTSVVSYLLRIMQSVVNVGRLMSWIDGSTTLMPRLYVVTSVETFQAFIGGLSQHSSRCLSRTNISMQCWYLVMDSQRKPK